MRFSSTCSSKLLRVSSTDNVAGAACRLPPSMPPSKRPGLPYPSPSTSSWPWSPSHPCPCRPSSSPRPHLRSLAPTLPDCLSYHTPLALAAVLHLHPHVLSHVPPHSRLGSSD
ncbi:hypothetical protein VFPPC_17746 [Pochonia chlamydosporia 170]|uniref:Uncharacterized protein n=1 Tax=Pochonia chlamydosporia 170 TaxID=1380566 RepID=A0A219AQM1_METCM|nr:hypothetical protein VFPPC_17746 [Pochonia chlamydosporia 170]OWT43078.1 hypothetical protein VFPPC_17746 [Pochonia chlamydosporia 170]